MRFNRNNIGKTNLVERFFGSNQNSRQFDKKHVGENQKKLLTFLLVINYFMVCIRLLRKSTKMKRWAEPYKKEVFVQGVRHHERE